jgi:hypothetical protein
MWSHVIWIRVRKWRHSGHLVWQGLHRVLYSTVSSQALLVLILSISPSTYQPVMCYVFSFASTPGKIKKREIRLISLHICFVLSPAGYASTDRHHHSAIVASLPRDKWITTVPTKLQLTKRRPICCTAANCPMPHN